MPNSVKVNTISKNINMDEPRSRSLLSSLNISRETSTHSEILFILYINRIEAQSNDLFWFDQTKQKIFQLFYASLKDKTLSDQNKDRANSFSHSPSTHVKGNVNHSNNDSNLSYSLNVSSISYFDLDPTDSKLWDSNLYPILLFGTIEKSTDNIKNIIKFLNQMAFFIDKKDFENHRELNLPYLKGFSQVA